MTDHGVTCPNGHGVAPQDSLMGAMPDDDDDGTSEALASFSP